LSTGILSKFYILGVCSVTIDLYPGFGFQKKFFRKGKF
jgi:hypothetical protein